MPPAEAEAVDGQRPQQQRQGGAIGNLIGTVFRMAFFWWLMKNWGKGGKNNSEEQAFVNIFSRGEPVDVKLFIDTNPGLTKEMLERQPDWELFGIRLAAEEEPLAANLTFDLPPSLQKNGSVYLHAVVLREGYDFGKEHAFFGRIQLNRYGPKRKASIRKNLLFDATTNQPLSEDVSPVSKEEEEPESKEIVNYWKPQMTIAFVDVFSKYTLSSVPLHLKPYFRSDTGGAYYYPMIYFNEFWLLKNKMIEINETVTSVSIELTVSGISSWVVQIITHVEEAFKTQAEMGLSSDEDTDDFKKILVEGNPILLAITFIVSLLHSVFDFLAFKNDIGFWKDNKSMEGLSAQSIIINAACQLIIFLYLLDNETSFVVLLSSGVGVLIECWKVTKAMNVSIDWSHGFPLLKFANRASYERSRTREHDEQAMRYLAYALYPLVVGYSIYALFNQSHKSWYSWILNSLVGAVYAFGFILMCPQLYLNYKLKSVAHLPWRQLTYKFLNTIIDDLFAFVIKMPWLHRLSVFRDDLVFLIYLYQWYAYGADKTRVNEFGFSEANQEPTQTAEQIKESESTDQSAAQEPTTTETDQEEEKNQSPTLDEELSPNEEASSGLRRRRNVDDGDDDVATVEEIDTEEMETKKEN